MEIYLHVNFQSYPRDPLPNARYYLGMMTTRAINQHFYTHHEFFSHVETFPRYVCGWVLTKKNSHIKKYASYEVLKISSPHNVIFLQVLLQIATIFVSLSWLSILNFPPKSQLKSIVQGYWDPKFSVTSSCSSSINWMVSWRP